MIKVYGPGLESGVFPDYQGHFFVDATGAGGGELHVSVMGLKGKYRRNKYYHLGHLCHLTSTLSVNGMIIFTIGKQWFELKEMVQYNILFNLSILCFSH